MQVLVRVGVSFVGVERACAHAEAEILALSVARFVARRDNTTL